MVKSNKRRIMKFAWRHNLIYPTLLLLWILLRKGNTFILSKVFNFSKNLIFTLLMFFAEFATGLILYLYQKSFLHKKKGKKGAPLIYKVNKMSRPDSYIKIVFIILVAGYSDFVEFILSTNYIPKFSKSSSSLDMRAGGISTISSALFFHYLLKFPILRHQVFSLLIIGICFILIIALEYYFQDINIFLSYQDFSLKIFLIILEQFFHSLLDSCERYVVEYNSINMFLVLSLEGFFGFWITFGFLYSEDTHEIQLKKIYTEKSTGMFALFILLLFFYVVLCGLKNAYRVVTNKLFSPMTKSLTDYFLNPFFLIQNYLEGDFVTSGKQNIFYFLVNFVLAIFINLFGCVFNEIIILFFWDLERDTYNQISYRSDWNYINDVSEISGKMDEDSELDN